MMSNELLDIEPQELRFIVEVKKQSSCTIRLFNKSDHHVAFKVKTTSPKKYCVRPNIGVIEPKSTTNFLVTMQAPRSAPFDMACKDKFLIQSAVVAPGTNDEDITSSLFTKENSKYVEESKLRVILTSPPNSPTLSPINGVHKHNEVPAYDTSPLKDRVLHENKNTSPQPKVTQDVAEPKLGNADPLVAIKTSDPEPVQDVEELELVKDINNLKSKISELELKLNEAEVTISKLTADRKLTTQESQTLQEELSLLRSKKCIRRVQVGFPFLFVCMVALISAVLGYLFRC